MESKTDPLCAWDEWLFGQSFRVHGRRIDLRRVFWPLAPWEYDTLKREVINANLADTTSDRKVD